MAAINTYGVTSSTAAAFRALNKFGMNLADFAALTTNSSFTGFGNGTGYTVTNWVSDGVFASVAAAQAVYPCIQDGNDHVDWVLLQSAADFLIYGSLGSSVVGSTKHKLFIPAGKFLINRTLHLGYNRNGTPPANLNGNGYISITLEGEGPIADVNGNGMTGTSIITEALTYPGIVASGYQQVIIRNLTVQGPYGSWMANNNPYRASNAWDRTAWRQTSPAIADANWIGGAAVNIGIGVDLYTNATSAAAYPARILPAAFGGGTTTALGASAGGTDITLEDVNVNGFIIGYGHPHGDSNAEFIRMNRGKIANCVHGVVIGHSQCRNVSFRDVDFYGFHTAIANTGGLTANANMQGSYENLHFGTGFQIIEHVNADWSGAVTLRDCYAESVSRLGTWTGKIKFDGSYLSFLEQEGTDGVPYNHLQAVYAVFDNCTVTGLRHGFVTTGVVDNATPKIEVTGGSAFSTGSSSVFTGHANATQIFDGLAYMQGLLHAPGADARIFRSNDIITQDGYSGRLGFSGADLRRVRTFLDQETVTYRARYPVGEYPEPADGIENYGAGQRFLVPKISRFQFRVDITSRSGFDLTCPRVSPNSDLKADVGDVFQMTPAGGGGLDDPTWFCVVSISGSDMVLRQMNNFNSTTATDYATNGRNQIQTSTWYNSDYICTRIRAHYKLWVGDVTSGSAVISNVRDAYRSGSTDNFNSTNFLMAAGDFYIHHEIERANTSGAALKNLNLVSSIDFTANTITLTENFNITRTNYPLPFYVEVYNA
jgi:hypothetical protein